MRAPRRFSRPTRGGRTTGTARGKMMLPPGMDIPKGTTPEGRKPIKTGGGRSLADAMRAVYNEKRKRRAGKARSTGTPKAPTRTKRPTTATPTRRTPPTTSRPRRPSGVSKPGGRGIPRIPRTPVSTGRPPRRMRRR